MKLRKTITIRGKSWKLERKRLAKNKVEELHGLCYGEPERRIVICATLKGDDLLETIIHEQTHGFFPDLKEETVEQFGEEMMRTLRQFGYKSDLGDDE